MTKRQRTTYVLLGVLVAFVAFVVWRVVPFITYC